MEASGQLHSLAALFPGNAPMVLTNTSYIFTFYVFFTWSRDCVVGRVTRVRAGRSGFRVGSVGYICDIPTQPGEQLLWGDWCGRTGQQSPRGGKMNILN
jgi:hypothetical protein